MANLAKLTVKEFFNGLKKPTIIGICGSQRDGSFNKMLFDTGMKQLEELGAIVKPLDLHAMNLPLYNPNDEASSFPAAAIELKQALVEADGIFITCPEYNGFVSPLLLNAITWATRGEGDMYAGFKSKIVSVMATSPGPMGGMRMLRSLAQMLQDMGSVVVPGHNAIGNSYKVFDKEGKITDERTMLKVKSACGQLVHFARYEANRERDCAIAKEIMKLKNMGEYGSVDT